MNSGSGDSAMIINIHIRLLNEVIGYCKSMAPQEACGAFLGVCDRDAGIVYMKEYVPVANVCAQPEHRFQMDMSEWIRLNYAAAKINRELVGICHSHLETPAIPSREDLQTLWYTVPSYWIVSLHNSDQPDVKVYQLLPNGYAALPLSILN